MRPMRKFSRLTAQALPQTVSTILPLHKLNNPLHITMHTTQKIFSGAAVAALLLTAIPACAQNIAPTLISVDASANASVGGASVSAKLQARIATAKTHADQEIQRRITMLTDLNTRVQEMNRLSVDQKAGVATSISTEISDLTTLRGRIDSDTDITTLKTDIKSIATSYRVFLLVIPQGRIQVAADKITAAATTLTALAGKLQTRIVTAQAAGTDTTTLSASLSDMNATLSDANVQASAAASEVANLTPDNGDATQKQTNDQAIKDARAKIQIALKDVQTARQDAGTIVKGLKGIGASANTNADASTSVQ